MGGRAVQSTIVGDISIVVVVGGGGGRGSGRRTAEIQIIKEWDEASHQSCGCCLKTTQLGHVTLSVWKRQISKGKAC